MRSIFALIAASCILAFAAPAFAEQAYVAADGAWTNDGPAYGVGVGLDTGANRFVVDLSRANLANGAHRIGFAITATHAFGAMSGFTPYAGVGVGFASDSNKAAHPRVRSVDGASVQGEVGLSHAITSSLTLDGYVRQTHDFVSHYRPDQTALGLRLRVAL